MSFDDRTRRALARLVGQARERLKQDITDQLRRLGFQENGVTLDIDRIAGLTEAERVAGQEIRALLEHFVEIETGADVARRQAAYDRLVREIGFTTLNRLVALRMAEERGIVIESVKGGFNSAGFQIYERVANRALGGRIETYRAYIECLYDELAQDLRALFDRSMPESLIFPSERCLEELFALINDPSLSPIWKEDEAIGWVYQYYNDPKERKRMREASSAPRNSRELAVRNQFFTPRYVVEFLTDNTLGRTWYEMRQGRTRLTDECRYLVKRKRPVFLKPGEQPPNVFKPTDSFSDVDLPGEMWVRPNPDIEDLADIWKYALTVGGYDYAEKHLGKDCAELANERAQKYQETGRWEGTFEELRCCLFFEQRRYRHLDEELGQEEAERIKALYHAICEKWDIEVEFIPHGDKKDPRDLKILDPACGSGHFLLYAFDLLETIYEEAWVDPELGPPLWKDLGWNPPIPQEKAQPLADPDSVRLPPRAIAHCFRCGWGGEVSEVLFILADLYGTPWVAGRPMIYCQRCAVEMEHRIALKIPLEQFNFGSALKKGWFAHSTGTIFLELAEVFEYELVDKSDHCMFQSLEAASEEHALLHLRRAVPELILRHNLYGIDIDARACQIAGLALWLRAQRTFQRLELKPVDRPRITRSNIVCAEPMPGERWMLEEYLKNVDPRLRELVRTIWEKMQLAGEAGSLLKIEDEIAEALAKARTVALVEIPPVQLTIFERDQPMQQTVMAFDISEERAFWDKAEGQLLEALREYAQQAGNGKSTQRRLFADDAAQGFAFVDICRQRFDVVLMNPPFGEFSMKYKTKSQESYPNSFNDILAAFVERFIERLCDRGLLGAITSRTAFFLGSFSRWRQCCVLRLASLRQMIDLGSGVMDDAMVEAAAYCVEKGPGAPARPAVFRVLGIADRDTALLRAIERLQEGVADPVIFQPRLGQLNVLPDSPFVYWVEEAVVRQLADLPAFEPTVGSVRQGLATGDNVRFVRAIWEVAVRSRIPPRSDRTAYADPCTYRWAPLIMAGASQPWFAPITVVVNWGKDGAELKNFVDERGKLKSRPQNAQFYFRPGLSWTRRAVRLIPYAIPAGCIPSASRYMAFPHPGQEFAALGVAASNVASAYMRFYGEDFERPNFLVQTMKSLPWPRLPYSLTATLEQVAEREVERRRRAYQNHEPFLEFTVPSACSTNLIADPLAFDRRSLLGSELDEAIAGAYGLSGDELTAVTRDLQEAVAVALHTKRDEDVSEGNTDEGEDENEGQDFVITDTPRDRQEALLSYAVGVALGRWDVRLALDPSLAPRLPGPFDPLPVCSPGMLVSPNGLPAETGRIASEDWLRARPNAITLPPEGSVLRATIADEEYPLRISWDGVLVDDPQHPDDIVRRVQEVLALLWPDRADAIEQEACEILGVSSLRDYFRRPAGFFADHLKRYSKSRRQAPIYWPLSTASGSYTLWVYYHRLTSDTLYTAVNRYVEQKLASVERELREAEGMLAAASGRAATRLREHVDSLRAFLTELRDLRDELLRVAALPYRPNLDDGVIINAAPLHRLFRHAKWAKDTKECWEKLQRGDYDWAHLAYTIWPDRVREKCRSDRSLAIAHGLEHLYVEDSSPKKTKARQRRIKVFDEENEDE